jgi:L-asparaginase II
MQSLVPLIETHRGDSLENIHFGAVAVCNTKGDVIASAGDPHWVTFTRSTLKALQALSFMESGGARELGFTPQNIALMCASHSGEPMHVEQAQSMLDKAGVTYKRLQCGCHIPYFVEQGVGPVPEHIDERMHNCSGKHSGFLAHCVQRGWSLDDYLEPSHPLQRSHARRARDGPRRVANEDGHRRLLGAEFRDAAVVARSRLRALGERRARQRIRRKLPAARRCDEDVPGACLGHAAQ